MDLERQGTSKKSDQEGLVYSVGSSLTQPQQHKPSWSISVLFRHAHGVKINFCLEAAKAGLCSNAGGDSTCKTDILSTETMSTCRWYNVSELCDIAKCYVEAVNPWAEVPGDGSVSLGHIVAVSGFFSSRRLCFCTWCGILSCPEKIKWDEEVKLLVASWHRGSPP